MNIYKISKYRKEIMGFATLWIFYFHVEELLFSNSSIKILKQIEWYIWKTGYCGVEIFLFLSGMGLVYAIHKETIKEFYFRRFLRVYPAFFVWFTLSTIIRSDKMTVTEYIGRLTFYTNWAENLLAYKWYIAVILMFYLWFPLYYYFLKKQKRPVVFTLLLIAVEFGVGVVFGPYIREDLFLFFNRIPIFAVGVLAGHVCREMPESRIVHLKGSKRMCLLYGIFMVMIFYYDYQLHTHEGTYLEQGVCNMLNLCIAIFLCLSIAIILDWLSDRGWLPKMRTAISFLGTISLEFYLTHELVLLKVKSYHLQFVPFEAVNRVLTMAACFAASLIAAWIIAKMAECIRRVTKEMRGSI